MKMQKYQEEQENSMIYLKECKVFVKEKEFSFHDAEHHVNNYNDQLTISLL